MESDLPSPSVSALFGFVPCAYSWALVKPSPSGSPLASPPLVGLSPLLTSQPSGRPSPSESALFMLVPASFSSALVKPSPSQSAPPSEGSRGSEPSPATTPALIASIRAVKIVSIIVLNLFSFIVIFFLYYKLFIGNPLFPLT